MPEVLDYIIRVRGGGQARREATDAAAGLERLQHAEHEAGDEAAQATPKLLVFGEALRALNRAASGGGAGGGLRTNLLGLSGSFGRVASLAVGAAPVLMGLAGALTAVAGSAAAAAGGAGAIGIGGVGALTVGLGGLLAVAAPVISGLKDIRTAQQQYNLAVQQYGYWSKEAGTAAQHLNAVVAVSGGRRVLALSREWDALTASFRRNTSAARNALLGAAGAGIGAARRLTPAFADAANLGAGAVGRGLTGAFATLGGPEVQGMIRSLGGVFARVSGPVIRAATDLFIALGRVAVAAGPYVEQIANGFATWAAGVRGMTGDSGRLSRFIGTLVGHLRSWWGLSVAIGRVFLILLGGSAREGRGLVDSLTGIVNRFGDWLEHARRTGQLQRFFRDAGQLLRAIGEAIIVLLPPFLGFVRSAIPPFTRFLRFIRPVVPELVAAFLGWRVATMLLNRAFAAAAAIGRWRTLTATIRGLPFGSLGRTGGGRFGRAFAGAAGPLAAAGFLAAMVPVVDDIIGRLGGGATRPGSRDRSRYGKFRGAAEPWIRSHIPGADWLYRHIDGGMAAGGVMRARGAAIVGEAGPELLDLPQGARISPLGAGGGDIILRVGQRELARVTRREITEQMARGG